MTPPQIRPAPGWAVAVALGTVYLVWGSTYLGIAVMIQTLPPLVAAGVRYGTAGLLLLVAVAAWRRARRQSAEPTRAVHLRTAAIVGTLLLLGGNGGVVLAEQRIPSGVAALIIGTIPIWMALLEAVLNRRTPGRLTVAGVAAGTVGVAILVVPLQGMTALDPLGVGLCAMAAISWAIGSVYAQRAPLPRNPFQTSGLQMVAGGAALLAVGSFRGELTGVDPSTFSTASLLAVAYLIGIGSIVAFSAYAWLLGHAPTSLISTYAYVNPVVAVVLGTAFLGETITPRTLFAFGIILVAVVAMVSGRPRRPLEAPVPALAEAEPAV